jgi:hypothetical protein
MITSSLYQNLLLSKIYISQLIFIRNAFSFIENNYHLVVFVFKHAKTQNSQGCAQ